MKFKVASGPALVPVHALARNCNINQFDVVEIRETDLFAFECCPCCCKFKTPIDFPRFANFPQTPDVMKFQRIGVADRYSGRALHLRGRPPSVQILVDPEISCLLRKERSVRRIENAASFSDCGPNRVRRTPRTFAASGNSFDYHYHGLMYFVQARPKLRSWSFHMISSFSRRLVASLARFERLPAVLASGSFSPRRILAASKAFCGLDRLGPTLGAARAHRRRDPPSGQFWSGKTVSSVFGRSTSTDTVTKLRFRPRHARPRRPLPPPANQYSAT
jgi:hypothetical protein